MQREALGMPDLALVVIDHPLGTLTDAEIDERAEQAASQCIAVWRGDRRNLEAAVALALNRQLCFLLEASGQ